MIVEIEAKFSCDDCGTEFVVGLDPGYDPPDNWTVMDIAEDSIRGELTYRDGTGEFPQGSGSIDGDGRHYCQRCTKKQDTLTLVITGLRPVI